MGKNVTREHVRIVQPGRALQVFFVIVLALFFGFVVWEAYIAKRWLVFGLEAPTLESRDWLFLIGLVSAIAGWVCSSLITLRNSIKQHTVSTFVQSRLSSPYAEVNRRVNVKHFSIHSPPGPIQPDFFLDPGNANDVHDINTVLNYFEFIAVGIRNGDLDELMLKQIMRSIVVNMCSKSSIYMDYVRDKQSPVGTARSFEHLLWLRDRWKE